MVVWQLQPPGVRTSGTLEESKYNKRNVLVAHTRTVEPGTNNVEETVVRKADGIPLDGRGWSEVLPSVWLNDNLLNRRRAEEKGQNI